MSEYIKRDDAVKLVAIILAAEAQIQGYNVDVSDCLSEAAAWVKDYCPGAGFNLVRCKECKWWASNCYHDNENATKCKFDGYTNADDYCSYGEREGE